MNHLFIQSLSQSLERILIEDCHAKVCGVYRRCFNLFTENQMLITIFSETRSMYPTSAVSNYPANCTFETSGIENGMHVIIQNGTITIPDADMCFDAESAKLYSTFRMPIKPILSAEKIRDNIRIFKNIIHSEKSEDGIYIALENNEVSQKATENIENLCTAIKRMDEKATYRSLRSLIGLGIGLTPSLDDVVTGISAWLCLFPAAALYQRFFMRILLAFVRNEGAFRTTLISRTFLEYTASGFLSDILYQMIYALMCKKEVRDIQKATGSMLAYGYSSGVETCKGILAGYSMTKQLAQSSNL